ncbi:helix-turn-helix domain-containing protein [Corynebacterium sp. USCH3]|uniref:helix-turn-helix domain-containing protein n=1 Tax=Corynebacterium sp. USCH3 TaxID=3024840 RepID=UPI0030B502B3
MSLDAYIWVTKRAPVPSPDSARLVLYGLAEHANERWQAWPSKQTLAGYLLGFTVDESRKTADPAYRKQVDASYQTVKRGLKVLKEGGWISMGDQSLVAHYPKYRRPRVWRLNLDYLRSESTDGVQHSTPGTTLTPGSAVTPGDNPDQDGGQHRSTQGTPVTRPGVSSVPQTPHINHPSKSKEGTGLGRGRSFTDAATALPERRKPSSHSPSPTHEPSRFEEWWALVPSDQKKKKANARTAYPKAVKRAGDEQTVINGMRGFIESGQPFDMNASTWLNQAKWQDAPPPTEPALSDENYVDYTDVPLHDLEASADPEIQSLILDSLNQE